ncbi:MAG: hypothetical protein HON68_02435 [Gammaproteobacteria bacterium]|jgi:hypothetical protein|nr:hypothetical protein [Gammaproteobacteria bacterium]MBT3490518.1 hypothetical protein [Gammaproteobacteria bacterium]MBT3717542.1 hypothetical protein [Gammaproteobacteria bacterium]MBT3845222.1 hypothetical protein [Gammaproteobacteria bacterium]MBT3892076.1 hypothetical protein [Gammaproteobacteria bacterium]
MNKIEKRVIYTLSSLTGVVVVAAMINLGVALNSNASAASSAPASVPDCTEGTKIERFHCGLQYR